MMKKPRRAGRTSWAKHVANMRRIAGIRCYWCASHPGQAHCDAQGRPLSDRVHHAGHYIDEARIAL